MPLVYQKYIKRKHLRANPDVLFVFGDNYLRKGTKGQAANMRGEPNAVGVATKWEPSYREEAYFNDDQYDKIIKILEDDLLPVMKHLDKGKIVVWPMDSIGTGLSALPDRAPRVWRIIQKAIICMEEM